MSLHSSKRRKLDHARLQPNGKSVSPASANSPANRNGETTSTAFSNRSLENSDSAEELDIDGSGDEVNSDAEESEPSTDDDQNVSLKQSHKARQAQTTAAQSQRKRGAYNDQEAIGAAHYAAGTFKSGLFKMQVEELLKQIRPRQGKVEKAAEEALHILKATIEVIPDRGDSNITDAKANLSRADISVPFPNPPPPKDVKYKLAYAKPASINVVGSYAVKTTPRTKDTLGLDMIVVMPTSLFQEKDYQDYRYFYRRSYYLACIAAGLKKKKLHERFSIEYEDCHDNPLKPVLVVRPHPRKDGPDQTPALNWKINIIPSLVESVFGKEKLDLERRCVREGAYNGEPTPTPFYNSSVRADMLHTSYLKLLHITSKETEAFHDACLLGSTWLRQRASTSSIHGGGFGNFEWAALLCLLLQGGGPGNKPVLSRGYSSYQMTKATLQLLATKDLTKQPLCVGDTKNKLPALAEGTPIFWDGSRSHNLLYKMSPWSYKLLRHEAKTAIRMLGDQQFDSFEAMFISRVDKPLLHFDQFLKLDECARAFEPASGSDPMQRLRELYCALERGLGDRVSTINIVQTSSEPWGVDKLKTEPRSYDELTIAFAANPSTFDRAVDYGPTAEQKAEATSFRTFWGEKAELRRFRDGIIRESLVWSTKAEDAPIFEQIVRYILAKHFAPALKNRNIYVIQSDLSRITSHCNSISAFHAFMESFRQLENDIRALADLPLSIRHIAPADAQLRYSSILVPGSGQNRVPADVILQFEGSARWPDDIVAIQRTKIAFLLKLGELLEASSPTITARAGLENSGMEILNQAFLDIAYEDGSTFRLRIHHDRQQTLFERQLKDKSLEPRAREIAAIGLAKFKRDYVKSPAHTQAIARLCNRHQTMSGTIRVMKHWIASHLLSNHISDEVVELMVASTYVQPWPWQAPSSVHAAFYRVLQRLARWDWRAQPLIVDLSGSGDLKSEELQSIRSKFDAWRQIDPSLSRVVLFAASNVDGDGTTWSDGNPLKVAASRMTALARAAVAEVDDKDMKLDIASLFVTPVADFDFVLHLDPLLANGRRSKAKSRRSVFKNLEHVEDDKSLIGFNAVKDLFDEMDRIFSSAVLFFSGGQVRPMIGGLWLPHTAPRSWTMSAAYSTTPHMVKGTEEVRIQANKEAILAEISRLGSDMIVRIDLKEA